MRFLIRQPFVHFVLLGVCIFALFALVDQSEPISDKPTILVSQQDAEWLARQFQATWNRKPNETELEGLIDEFIREEIYVREALALGLDQGDKIVRNRLRQKMEFLTEAGAEANALDDDVLKAFFQANEDLFKAPPRLALTQVLIPDDQTDTAKTLVAELAGGADPALLGQRTLLPMRIPLSTQQSVDGTFGAGFFAEASSLTPRKWTGPVRSGYGLHVVYVDTLEDGRMPPFESVRDRVELMWRAEKAKELRAERFTLLKNQYQIDRPDIDPVLSQ